MHFNRPIDNAVVYQSISTAFCVIVIISNIISAKMVSLPFFHDVCIPCGLITYPLTFLLSDLVTEIFGANPAKRMVYMTLGMNVLTFMILEVALTVPAHSLEDDRAFHAVLGLSGIRIFSSLIAYTISQIADIQIYSIIKRWTGKKFLWIRANGSTWISQILDTILIDMIFLFWGLGMSIKQVLPIMLFSITYKAFFSIIITPFFYLLVFAVRNRILIQKI